MVKGLQGYNEAQATSFSGELPKLEPGGYVLRIINVKVEDTQWGARLALQFDIAEGENKGFFKQLYDATPDSWDNKKWKGSYRMKFPVNEGDQARFNKSLGFFKSQLEAFEKSNAGLKINAAGDWDEQVLKGKLVGAVFNEKEWEMNGSTGFFTQCKRLIPADDIRQGNYSIPKPDMLKRDNAAQNYGYAGNNYNNYPANNASPFMQEAQAQTQAQPQAQTAPAFEDFEVFSDDGVPF